MLRCIYINREVVLGPWGGGNRFLKALIDALTEAGHVVTHDPGLKIDVAFCMDPRPGSTRNLLDYQGIRKLGVPIIQRVGDLGTHGKPELLDMLFGSVHSSDVVVFPSQWALDYFWEARSFTGLSSRNESGKRGIISETWLRPALWHVIKNAPASIFYDHRSFKKELPEIPSIVTHHWSTNPKKGFQFYDELSRTDAKFQYYGRAQGNQTIILNSEDLSMQLPKFDIYLSASEEEAGANHVLEALACGLPVIYHENGGSIPEYCKPYGVPFDGSIGSFQLALKRLRVEYRDIIYRLSWYNDRMENQAKMYVDLIEGL